MTRRMLGDKPLTGAERVRRFRTKEQHLADRVRKAARAERERNIDTINNLYGTSGPGRVFLLEVFARYALDLLPDAAITELADMHVEAYRSAPVGPWDRIWAESGKL